MKVAIYIAFLLVLVGCKSVQYVPVETERIEYNDRIVERWTTDTISDTRLIYVNGDTIRDIRYRDRVREVVIRDTCYIERTISEPTPYPVERELTRWERTKIDLGGYAFAALAVLAFLFARRVRNR